MIIIIMNPNAHCFLFPDVPERRQLLHDRPSLCFIPSFLFLWQSPPACVSWVTFIVVGAGAPPGHQELMLRCIQNDTYVWSEYSHPSMLCEEDHKIMKGYVRVPGDSRSRVNGTRRKRLLQLLKARNCSQSSKGKWVASSCAFSCLD